MKKIAICNMAFAAASVMFISGSELRASDIDDKIEAAFPNTYVYKTYLKNDSVSIDSKDGIVTLTGNVSEELHKALALETASALPGVTKVNSQLTTKAEDAKESADTWIGRKISLNLLFHRHVNASATTVDVKNGIVTLKGNASSTAQKELTSEYAKDIDGVKDVKNEMTVSALPEPAERTASEKIDDASVSAQVKTALLTHRSTSAITTKVETRNGEVTLTGIAKNEVEKTLVTKIVTDIQGVINVKNQMTVQEIKTK